MNDYWLHRIIIDNLYHDGKTRVAVAKRTLEKYLFQFFDTMSDEIFYAVFNEMLWREKETK